MTNNNELVSRASTYLSEAILNINENKDRFEPIKLRSENGIITALINRLPESDDDREGWLDSLAIAIIGYRNTRISDSSTTEEQQNNEISKNLQSQLEEDYKRWGNT